jgi:hypothetical protein
MDAAVADFFTRIGFVPPWGNVKFSDAVVQDPYKVADALHGYLKLSTVNLDWMLAVDKARKPRKAVFFESTLMLIQHIAFDIAHFSSGVETREVFRTVGSHTAAVSDKANVRKKVSENVDLVALPYWLLRFVEKLHEERTAEKNDMCKFCNLPTELAQYESSKKPWRPAGGRLEPSHLYCSAHVPPRVGESRKRTPSRYDAARKNYFRLVATAWLLKHKGSGFSFLNSHEAWQVACASIQRSAPIPSDELNNLVLDIKHANSKTEKQREEDQRNHAAFSKKVIASIPKSNPVHDLIHGAHQQYLEGQPKTPSWPLLPCPCGACQKGTSHKAT